MIKQTSGKKFDAIEKIVCQCNDNEKQEILTLIGDTGHLKKPIDKIYCILIIDKISGLKIITENQIKFLEDKKNEVKNDLEQYVSSTLKVDPEKLLSQRIILKSFAK